MLLMMVLISSETLIGSPKEKSKKLKTKDNVDLVGLSLPLLHLNLSKPSKKELSEISLNNNLLTVPDLMEITDVTVV